MASFLPGELKSCRKKNSFELSPGNGCNPVSSILGKMGDGHEIIKFLQFPKYVRGKYWFKDDLPKIGGRTCNIHIQPINFILALYRRGRFWGKLTVLFHWCKVHLARQPELDAPAATWPCRLWRRRFF